MAKFGQFSRFTLRKCIRSYRSHFTTSLLLISYSAPSSKKNPGERTILECLEFNKIRAWSFPPPPPPKSHFPPQIWTRIHYFTTRFGSQLVYAMGEHSSAQAQVQRQDLTHGMHIFPFAFDWPRRLHGQCLTWPVLGYLMNACLM